MSEETQDSARGDAASIGESGPGGVATTSRADGSGSDSTQGWDSPSLPSTDHDTDSTSAAGFLSSEPTGVIPERGGSGSGPAADMPSSEWRFVPLRPHAEGGLGQVWIYWDRELHREVAFKEIKPPRDTDPHHQKRLLVEGEITGRLEHPGIVPVYSLSRRADGRPFYVMRFVGRTTFKEAIEEYQARPANDPERPRALRGLLGRVVAACQTIGYAHSKGILHRDIKPSNVILGPFGETLVLDWGLAKPFRPDSNRSGATIEDAVDSGAETLTESRTRDERQTKLSLLEVDSASDLDLTEPGDVKGSPAYMSPEQADGDSKRVGPTSDVYGLGALLYHVLTGRPPVQGRNRAELLLKVRAGRLDPIEPSVPRPLAAICRKAMAWDPEERYPSAAELADDLDRWLADEPVLAWPEPWNVRAGRWLRRHRAAVRAAAVVLMLVVAGLIVHGQIVRRERDVAEANFDLAFDVVNRMLHQVVDGKLSEVNGAEDVRRDLAIRAVSYFTALEGRKTSDPRLRKELALAYRRAGNLLRMMGDEEKPRAWYQAALALTASADERDLDVKLQWAMTLMDLGTHERVFGHLQASDAALTQAEAVLARFSRQFPDDLRVRRDLAHLRLDLADTARQLGQFNRARVALDAAYETFRTLFRTIRPQEPFDGIAHMRTLNGLTALTRDQARVSAMSSPRPDTVPGKIGNDPYRPSIDPARHREVLADFEKTARNAQAFTKTYPGRSQGHYLAAETALEIADLLIALDSMADRERARTLVVAAASELEKLDVPNSRLVVERELAARFGELSAAVALAQGRIDEAEASALDARQDLLKLRDLAPGRLSTMAMLAQVETTLARIAERRNWPDVARVWLNLALPRQERVVTACPDDPRDRALLAALRAARTRLESAP